MSTIDETIEQDIQSKGLIVPRVTPADELEEVLRERDDAEDFINELLDEVLGADRPEWSSAYNRYDAMNDVRERITALHKPAVDKAWGRFELAMAAPQPVERKLLTDDYMEAIEIAAMNQPREFQEPA